MATDRSNKAKALADKAKNFVTLAHVYRPEKDNIDGWVASEKLDGVRARWVDGQLLSRNMKPFLGVSTEVLGRIRNVLGDVPADGELWCGRGRFQKTVSLVKNSRTTLMDWLVEGLAFRTFDVVEGGTWRERSKPLFMPWRQNEIVVPVPHIRVDSLTVITHAEQVYREGGEGLILRDPSAPYIFGRTHRLLKVKCHEDAEAIVVGHIPGEGKHKGRVGALVCKWPKGIEFKVGGGLTDAEREAPPVVGETITMRYMGLTTSGHPREPRFIAVRDYE